MDFIDVIILGVVEGVSEFLPISSTGHLILTARLLNLEQTEFLKMFEVVIQLGAILSIVVLYTKRVLFDVELIRRLAVAMIPSVVVGGFFYDSIKQLFESEVVVTWALLLGGILILLFEWWHKESPDAEENISSVSYKTAFLVGVFQSLAVIPGVSRAGATILGGLLLGMKRTVIVEFSFLLAVPTMLAASVLDIYKNGGLVMLPEWGLLAVGFVVSFVVALISVKWLLRFIETNTFVSFGVYRIVLALIFMTFVL